MGHTLFLLTRIRFITAMALTLSAAIFRSRRWKPTDGAQPTAKQGALATVIPHVERSPSSVERSPSTWESLRASALPTSTWLAEILRPQGCEDSSGLLVGTLSPRLMGT